MIQFSTIIKCSYYRIHKLIIKCASATVALALTMLISGDIHSPAICYDGCSFPLHPLSTLKRNKVFAANARYSTKLHAFQLPTHEELRVIVIILSFNYQRANKTQQFKPPNSKNAVCLRIIHKRLLVYLCAAHGNCANKTVNCTSHFANDNGMRCYCNMSESTTEWR